MQWSFICEYSGDVVKECHGEELLLGCDEALAIALERFIWPNQAESWRD